MGLFRHYMRVFFRTNFKPIPQHTAKKWELNYSLLYLYFACATFGVALYKFMTNPNKDSPYAGGLAITPYEAMRKFGAAESKSTLIRVKGFNVEKEHLTLEEIQQKCEEEQEKVKSAQYA